ncbi:MAG TPA: hypothetical protein VG326_20720 [Tepidisphaeraceae bacterium]|jgi:hypothetical protein|nr:hypothetical protein [Tepidisphaeraceae bacterium]
MNLIGLEKLKTILADGKDLSAAFHYFLDHFGEKEAFLNLGKPKRHPLLESLLTAVAGQMFGKKVAMKRLFLIPVPGTKFIHGAGLCDGRPINVIYFDDIKVGIAAVMRPPNGSTQYSRFSAQMIPPEAAPSNN